jgi:hypothetical protein
MDLHGKPVVAIEPFEEPRKAISTVMSDNRLGMLFHQSPQRLAKVCPRSSDAAVSRMVTDLPGFSVYLEIG